MGSYWGYIEVILGLYGGYMGIMETKMDTTICPIVLPWLANWAERL